MDKVVKSRRGVRSTKQSDNDSSYILFRTQKLLVEENLNAEQADHNPYPNAK